MNNYNIPLLDFIISNKNFDDIQPFENYNLKIERINDIIEITFKLTYSVNVYIYEENSFYYVSFIKQLLLNKFGDCIENKIIRRYTFFKKLILTKSNYNFIDDNNELYTISLNSDKGIQILKNWIGKYENIMKSINPKQIRIELSSGIDTRILSYFWRNLPYTYDVYTKDDPDEVNDALNVINHINKNCKVNINTICGSKELSSINKSYSFILNGSNLIHGLYRPTTLEDFYDRIFNCSFRWNKGIHTIRNIVPFYDKDYLKLLGSYPGQMKIVLLLYLCKEYDLYKLPIRSLGRKLIDLSKFDESEILEKLKK